LYVKANSWFKPTQHDVAPALPFWTGPSEAPNPRTLRVNTLQKPGLQGSDLPLCNKAAISLLHNSIYTFRTINDVTATPLDDTKAMGTCPTNAMSIPTSFSPSAQKQ
jgi:hypothetical protein